MGIVLRLSEHGAEACCICAQPLGELQHAVQMFVFWPGDEDPARWLAHERCVADRTLITHQLGERKEGQPSTQRDRAG